MIATKSFKGVWKHTYFLHPHLEEFFKLDFLKKYFLPWLEQKCRGDLGRPPKIKYLY